MRMWLWVLLAGGLAAPGAAESPAGLWDSWDWPGRLQNREEGSMRMGFGVSAGWGLGGTRRSGVAGRLMGCDGGGEWAGDSVPHGVLRGWAADRGQVF